MNFLKRYRCRSSPRPTKDDEDTSLVSDSGLDVAECAYPDVPAAEEIDRELYSLVHFRGSESTESLYKIHYWSTVVTSDINHDAGGRIFVKHQVVPTILLFMKGLLKEGNNALLLEKTAKILQQCTSFHDRHTKKQEKYSKDMILQLVKHDGVKILVTALDRYCDKPSRKRHRALFKNLWTTLLNVATCDKAVTLLKIPRTDLEQQERLLLGAIPAYLERAEAEVPAFWLERLFIALHYFIKFNGEPDAQTRQLLARNRVVNKLLHMLMIGRRQLAATDPCVTALAMSFFLTCVEHGVDHDKSRYFRDRSEDDELHNSIDMDRLARFTIRAMKAFPSSHIIQGSGHVLLNKIPSLYRVLACNDSTVILPSSCGADIDNDASGPTSNVFASLVGSCWMCRPSHQ
ncbi:hypothetical protein IV203_004299 [Nitzschia inconspicua]|uniref:Uncharacterized protein n=1 Tax=Nitzschia inconspicua TaxID=303405 RepID=A0A9K3PPR0_9STRA|nr:hypothetical protein IV203_004299 [Nitzschia inconspicua]